MTKITKAEKHFSYELINLPQKVYVLYLANSVCSVHKTLTGAMDRAGVPFIGPCDGPYLSPVWNELVLKWGYPRVVPGYGRIVQRVLYR